MSQRKPVLKLVKILLTCPRSGTHGVLEITSNRLVSGWLSEAAIPQVVTAHADSRL